MHRYIFLDFDGVLNDPYWIIKHHYLRYKRSQGLEFDLRRVEYLARIVDYTGAKLVLSSSWNMRDGVKEFFQQLGFEVAGQLGNYSNRGQAIDSWQAENNVRNCPYIIIDDEWSDYDPQQREHLVYTGDTHVMGGMVHNFSLSEKKIGLDEIHVHWAIRLLKGDIENYINNNLTIG